MMQVVSSEMINAGAGWTRWMRIVQPTNRTTANAGIAMPMSDRTQQDQRFRGAGFSMEVMLSV